MVQINQLGSSTLELCDSCVSTLQNIVTFRKQCLNSIGYLSGKLQFNFVYVEDEGANDDGIEIKLEECLDEEESLPLKVEVIEAKNSHYGLRESRKKKFRSPPPSPKTKPERKNKQAKETKLDAKKRESAYCSICGEFFQRNLLKHILNFHTMHIENNQFKCNVCEEICRDSGTIMEHFNKHRDYEQPKMCKVCELEFKNRKEYRVHVKSHQDKKQEKRNRMYPCDCCEATYASNTNLKYHVMAKHQGEVSF